MKRYNQKFNEFNINEKPFVDEVNKLYLRAINFNSLQIAQAYSLYINISKILQERSFKLSELVSDIIEYKDVRKSEDWVENIFNSTYFVIFRHLNNSLKTPNDFLKKVMENLKIISDKKKIQDLMREIYLNSNRIKKPIDIYNIIEKVK